MLSFSGEAGGALLTALLITILEMTEVVAFVTALGAGARDLRPGFTGALAGVGVVAAFGLAAGLGLVEASSHYGELVTLLIGALLLWGFGLFLLRSTLRTYLREDRRHRNLDVPAAPHPEDALGPKALLATGFSVGTVEALETVVVLLGLVAGGWVGEAIIGALVGGVLLIAAGFVLHERIRRLKVPPLKWVSTSLLFTYALFWSLEALGDLSVLPFPSQVGTLPSDVLLVPIFVLWFLLVRGVVELRLLFDRRAAA